MWSVTIDRDGLSLADLTIDGNFSTGSPNGGKFHLSEEDCTWPSFAMRREYAPDSTDQSGRIILGAVRDQGQMTLGVYAHADTTGDVKTRIAELEAAFSQLRYDLTLVVDGVTIGTYEAHAELPQWGNLDSGEIRAKLVGGTIVIPLNPPAA